MLFEILGVVLRDGLILGGFLCSSWRAVTVVLGELAGVDQTRTRGRADN